MQPRVAPLLAVVLLAACAPPPPAPKGLDESAKYMVRNFWADDQTFLLGIQGFVDWFENGDPENGDPPGKELLGLIPGQQGKTTDAFTVADLDPADIALYPLDAEILVDTVEAGNPDDDVMAPRDLGEAPGVVSLAEMDCEWTEAEQLLLRPDQHVVFQYDWEGYERTYATPRADYERGTSSGTFTPIPESIDPYADGFDLEAYADAILFTDNVADPKSVLGANLPGYALNLEFRHGSYEVTLDGETQTLGGFAIVTYNPAAVWGPDAKNGLVQSYSIEINLERPGDKTLRMLAVWAQPMSKIPVDEATALTFAVNKSQKSSETLTDICSGKTVVADEP